MDKAYLKCLLKTSEAIELRIFVSESNKLHGFFDNIPDIEKALNGYGSTKAVYSTVNPSKKDPTNSLTKILRGKGTTDKDITRIKWLLMDFDPIRDNGKKDCNTTDKELDRAKKQRDKALEAMTALGWPVPLIGMSGNGTHMMWRVDLPANDDTKALYRNFYKSINKIFTNEEVDCDITVKNPSRIWKVYGTTPQKGPATADRPHRESYVKLPKKLEVVNKDLIVTFIELFPPDNKNREKPKNTNQQRTQQMGDYTTLDIVAYFKAHNLYKCHLDDTKHAVACPWEDEHTTTSGQSTTVVFEAYEGFWPSFKCQHSHCHDKVLMDVMTKVGPAHKFCEQDWVPPESSVDYADLSDWGNAKRMMTLYGENMIYIPKYTKWFIWDNISWRLDADGGIQRIAKAVSISLITDAKEILDEKFRKLVLEFCRQSQNLGRLKAMIEVAQSEKGVTIQDYQLDQHPYYIACGNGVLDLRTGDLVKPEREFYITKRMGCDYDKNAPTPQIWLDFLNKIFAGNKNLVNFIQRAMGYSLSALIGEQKMLILHGSGSNGKSTLINALDAMMGELLLNCQPNTLMATKNGSSGGGAANNDVARLSGARCVTSVEGEEGVKLNEALIKQVTGGDTITARFLYAESFEFTPQFKLWYATNHYPVISGTDYAIWRRLLCVPFLVQIPPEEIDYGLGDKLAMVLPGILNWCLEGFKEWEKQGLNAPPEVLMATEVYRQEQDTFGQWLDEECYLASRAGDRAEISGMLLETNKMLYENYTNWCTEIGAYPVKTKKFASKLIDRGARKIRKAQGVCYEGVQLRK